MMEDNDNSLPEQRYHLKAPKIWRRRSGDFEVDSSEILLSITQDTVVNDDDTEENVEGEEITDNNDPLTDPLR